MLWINSCILYATSYQLFRQTTNSAVQRDMTWTNSEISSFYICRFENFYAILTVKRDFPHVRLNSHLYFWHWDLHIVIEVVHLQLIYKPIIREQPWTFRRGRGGGGMVFFSIFCHSILLKRYLELRDAKQ
jgi:hypothetical protein